MNTRKSILGLSLLIFLARASGEAPADCKEKALAVLNAVRFVSWPTTRFEAPSAPLVIGLLGDNPCGPLLENTVKGETVHNRRIQVRTVTLEEATACHVLLVGKSEREHLEAIRQVLGDGSVLTISEIEGFVKSEGMLELARERGNVRFLLNPDPVRRARLKVDSQFLVLCRIANY